MYSELLTGQWSSPNWYFPIPMIQNCPTSSYGKEIIIVTYLGHCETVSNDIRLNLETNGTFREVVFAKNLMYYLSV